MHEGLIDCDHQDEVRRLARNLKPRLERSVSHDAALAADTERVAMTGYHEDKRHVRTLDHVRNRIEPLVAGPVWNGQRLFVENGDEPGRIAPG